MKIRQGFVTNSSSSSFIVAMKKDVGEKEIEKIISDIFSVEENHVLHKMCKRVVKKIVETINSQRKYDCFTTIEDLCKYYDIDTEELTEYGEKILGLFNKYGTFMSSGFYSDDDSIEGQLLYNLNFEYEDDNIYFENS